jgi:predicted  nucleic acid-binding Zn-ribbon protein
MPSALEAVQIASDQALKQMDAEVRRLNRSANDSREDVKKARAEYEALVKDLTAAKQELATLKDKSGKMRSEIDTYRNTALDQIEKKGDAALLQEKRLAQSMRDAEAAEQKAHAALAEFKEARGAFLVKVKSLQTTLNKAIETLLA